MKQKDVSLKRSMKRQTSTKNDKGKKKKTQITNIRNETGDITIDPEVIKKILRGYYKQVYTHKFDNLSEMDQFLEIQTITIHPI